MRQEEFEKQHSALWKEFEKTIALFDRSRNDFKASHTYSTNFPKQYRSLCHTLAIAKERQYSPYLVEHLDSLVLQGHQIFYTRHSNYLHQLTYFFLHGFPKLFQNYKGLFWLMTTLFYGPALLIFGLTIAFPDLIYSVVPTDQVVQFENMYDPEVRVLGRERESDSDFMMFGHYIQNNIGIAFRTFATGILLTVGTLFFILFNGVFFGVVSGHIVNLKYTSTFFPFVIGHGSFELTAIVISGMGGMILGWSIISPGNRSRLDSLKYKAKDAIQLVSGAGIMLFIAAFIEAFWSSSTQLTIEMKYWVGGFFWLFVFAYLFYPRREQVS